MIKRPPLILLLLLYVLQLGGQQLCDGNLGINNFDDGDFGTGQANVIQADPNIAPGYLYSNTGTSPMDGFYTLTNDISAWSFNYPTWLNIGDNSDDPEGYMMVINASFQPGIFYTQEVSGLCENTLYQFSADVINLIRIPVSDHIEPNLDFLIDDVVRFSSGDVPQDAQWHTYGFTFTTDPGQTTVKLSLRNNAPGGNGNDLAIDNISFQACGPDAFVTADKTIFLCEDDNQPTEIRAEISASNQALQWQFSLDSIIWENIGNLQAEFITHNLFDVGRYYYRYLTAGTEVELMNEKCRIISDVLVVEVLQQDYQIDSTICFNEIFDFGSQTLTESGSYFEAFISSRGCDSFVDLDLIVLKEEILDLDSLLIDPRCFGESNGSIKVEVINGDYEPYNYAINEVSTSNNLFEGLSSGDYTITITNTLGCESIVAFTLEDPELFEITVPKDTCIALGENMDVVILTNQEIESIFWTPSDISPCGDCTEFSFLPLSSELYTATAYNEAGCEATDGFKVKLNIEDLGIYIPDVFDPSLAGIDDNFTIGAKEGLIKNIRSIHIYDRWGNLIHSDENTTDLRLWDGRIDGDEVNPGVYVYLLKLELIDGNEYDFAGDVFVLK